MLPLVVGQAILQDIVEVFRRTADCEHWNSYADLLGRAPTGWPNSRLHQSSTLHFCVLCMSPLGVDV